MIQSLIITFSIQRKFHSTKIRVYLLDLFIYHIFCEEKQIICLQIHQKPSNSIALITTVNMRLSTCSDNTNSKMPYQATITQESNGDRIFFLWMCIFLHLFPIICFLNIDKSNCWNNPLNRFHQYYLYNCLVEIEHNWKAKTII